jgi:hypothetical protein
VRDEVRAPRGAEDLERDELVDFLRTDEVGERKCRCGEREAGHRKVRLRVERGLSVGVELRAVKERGGRKREGAGGR